MKESEPCSINEIAYIISRSLDERNTAYTVEYRDGLIIIWFDEKNQFYCKIGQLDIEVYHLEGSVNFNLDEGKDADIVSANDAIDHIFQVMSNELLQEETYKKNKLCSTKQYLIANGKKVSYSSLWIRHIFYFLPLVKKEVRITKYNYQK